MENTNPDIEIGNWIYNRPYVWLEDENIRKCWRLYLAYDNDRVYTPEGKTEVRNVFPKGMKNMSLINIWKSYSKLKTCDWVIQLFAVYVAERDGPLNKLEVRQNGHRFRPEGVKENVSNYLYYSGFAPGSINFVKEKVTTEPTRKELIPVVSSDKSTEIIKPPPFPPTPFHPKKIKKPRVLPTFLTQQKKKKVSKTKGRKRPQTLAFQEWVRKMRTEREEFDRLAKEAKQEGLKSFDFKVGFRLYNIDVVKRYYHNLELPYLTLTKVKGKVRTVTKKVDKESNERQKLVLIRKHLVVDLWTGNYYKYDTAKEEQEALDQYYSDMVAFNDALHRELENMTTLKTAEPVLRQEPLLTADEPPEFEQGVIRLLSYDDVYHYLETHKSQLQELNKIALLEDIEEQFGGKIVEKDVQRIYDFVQEPEYTFSDIDISFSPSPVPSPVSSKDIRVPRELTDSQATIPVSISDEEDVYTVNVDDEENPETYMDRTDI